MSIRSKHKAFTLAEAIMVLVLLGIVAAIVTPSAINRSTQSQHKTMVKKAMNVYDKTLSTMVITENIQSQAQLEATDCEVLQRYFKSIRTNGRCKFQTSDKLWWNINDINHPMISFKEEDLTDNMAKSDNTENKAFYFSTVYDTKARAFVSNNFIKERFYGNYADDMEKLYEYLGWETAKTISELCAGKDVCVVKNITYRKLANPIPSRSVSVSIDCIKDGIFYDKGECPDSEVEDGLIWVSDPIPLPTKEDATSEKNCKTSSSPACRTNGDYYNFAKRMCDESGGKLTNLAELFSSNCGGKGCGGYYWTDEDAGNAYISIDSCNGWVCTVYKDNAFNNDFKSICVGK